MEINEENIDLFTKELKKVAQIEALIKETKELMKPFQERLKQLKFEKKELEKNICPTMEKNDLKKAELPNNIGVIEYKVTQAIVPITQIGIRGRMSAFFKEGPGSLISFNSKSVEEKAQELYDYIYGKNNRTYVKKEALKCVKI